MCVNLSERNCAVYLFFIILIISLTCKILNSLFLPCESFVKETGSINEDEPWFVAGGFWNNFCLSRSKLQFSENCCESNLLEEKKNKTTEFNVSDHFNNIFLSNSQLTYVKALQAIAKSAYDFHIHKYL